MTFNCGNFQTWLLSILVTFKFGNFQFWQLSVLATFNFGNFQLNSSKILTLTINNEMELQFFVLLNNKRNLKFVNSLPSTWPKKMSKIIKT